MEIPRSTVPKNGFINLHLLTPYLKRGYRGRLLGIVVKIVTSFCCIDCPDHLVEHKIDTRLRCEVPMHSSASLFEVHVGTLSREVDRGVPDPPQE